MGFWEWKEMDHEPNLRHIHIREPLGSECRCGNGVLLAAEIQGGGDVLRMSMSARILHSDRNGD